jgi:hypothetical protein
MTVSQEPQVDVRFEFDLLDEAARARVEQVIRQALQEELAKQPLPTTVRSQTIIIGRIPRDVS